MKGKAATRINNPACAREPVPWISPQLSTRSPAVHWRMQPKKGDPPMKSAAWQVSSHHGTIEKTAASAARLSAKAANAPKKERFEGCANELAEGSVSVERYAWKRTRAQPPISPVAAAAGQFPQSAQPRQSETWRQLFEASPLPSTRRIILSSMKVQIAAKAPIQPMAIFISGSSSMGFIVEYNHLTMSSAQRAIRHAQPSLWRLGESVAPPMMAAALHASDPAAPVRHKERTSAWGSAERAKSRGGKSDTRPEFALTKRCMPRQSSNKNEKVQRRPTN
mmetsp:Transcript_95623/g.189566  ORF Transcript_95623/g.189566 Transcript_95623/m.189566 type:complete len:279 (-) Transcript_95623:390-1226(-)